MKAKIVRRGTNMSSYVDPEPAGVSINQIIKEKMLKKIDNKITDRELANKVLSDYF